jgi:hypothetical protein
MFKKIIIGIGSAIGTVLTIWAVIWGISEVRVKSQLKEERAIRADSIVLQEVRTIRIDISTIKLKVGEINSKQDQQANMVRSLDRSYTNHLKKNESQMNELIQYQEMQLQKEELKKNETP